MTTLSPRDQQLTLNHTFRSNDKSTRSGSRHKSSPKNKIKIPDQYLKSNNIKQFLKSHRANLSTTFNSMEIASNTKILLTEEERPHLRSTTEIKASLIKINKITSNQYTRLFDQDYDYGRLDKLRQSRTTLKHQSAVPTKMVVSKPNLPIDDISQNLKSSSHTKVMNQEKSSEKKQNSEKNFSRKQIQIAQKIKLEITKTNKKRVNSSSDIRQNKNPNIMEINEKNLKFDKTINPNQRKKINSKVVTMFSGGKIQTRIINYPDNSQYLKLCGLRE